jgi:Protein of unknown function (DUF4007)
MAYGQHQSFYLRDRWLNKALKQLQEDNRFFYDKEAFEKIGLGKNMVQSLRFWVIATNVVKEEYDEQRKKVHSLTKFGSLIYQYDRFVQFEETSAILHYYLVTRKEPATAWFWFYNINKEKVFTKEYLLDQFIDWVKQVENKSVSEKSLKRDIDCLLKLYTADPNVGDPEEVIRTPFDFMKLIVENDDYYFKQSPKEIHPTALMYTLLSFTQNAEVASVTIEEIESRNGLWGKVFNLDRNMIVNSLEKLIDHPKYPIKFIRTNQLDTIWLPEVSPLDYLEFELKRKVG